MKEKIKKICKQIESELNVKILFAVENGSRAWRMESSNSDYDVRFVFKRPIEEYIKIDKSSEVIQRSFDKDLNKVPVEGCLIDVSGFDVLKFTKMLWSSNPTVIEWLTTDIVYYGKQNKVFQNFAKNQFKKISLYYHYKSMCKNNYIKYIQSKNDVTYKRYLYSMRGLINAKWVAHKGSIPPIKFPQTLKEINKNKRIIPKEIISKLQDMINLKKKGKEKDIVQNIVKIDKYIDSFLKDDSEAPKEKQLSTQNELNKELRKVILSK